uniref:Peptidase S1 domain-containing protein n=1 Tax=Romanomermis culicivorax TaxID=13658 RepID=A0A915HE91_ROMCU
MVRSKRVVSNETELAHSKPWMVFLDTAEGLCGGFLMDPHLNHSIAWAIDPSLIIARFDGVDGNGVLATGDSGSPVVCKKDGKVFAQGIHSGSNGEIGWNEMSCQCIIMQIVKVEKNIENQ